MRREYVWVVSRKKFMENCTRQVIISQRRAHKTAAEARRRVLPETFQKMTLITLTQFTHSSSSQCVFDLSYPCSFSNALIPS
jgi:hypothetical protein